MRGIKTLFAVLFVFLFCNTVFANVADTKNEISDMTSFQMASSDVVNGTVNYRRGADDAPAAPGTADDRKGRGRGRTGNEVSDMTSFQVASSDVVNGTVNYRRGADDAPAAPGTADDRKGRGRGRTGNEVSFL